MKKNNQYFRKKMQPFCKHFLQRLKPKLLMHAKNDGELRIIVEY